MAAKKKTTKKKATSKKSKANKGSVFEREQCKLWSLWWTHGERNDVFWRSITSGAMATIRSKKGQTAFGQYGDIQATDPIGQPLIDVCTIELKCGYPRASLADILDKKANAAQQQYEAFIEQAMGDAKKSGSFSWMLLFRRMQKDPFIIMPIKLYKKLKDKGAFEEQPPVSIRMKINLRRKLKKKKYTSVSVYGLRLEDFFNCVKPIHFKRIAKGKNAK